LVLVPVEPLVELLVPPPVELGGGLLGGGLLGGGLLGGGLLGGGLLGGGLGGGVIDPLTVMSVPWTLGPLGGWY